MPITHVDWCLERNGLDLSVALCVRSTDPQTQFIPKSCPGHDKTDSHVGHRFAESSKEAAAAMSPVGSYMLRQHVLKD